MNVLSGLILLLIQDSSLNKQKFLDLRVFFGVDYLFFDRVSILSF